MEYPDSKTATCKSCQSRYFYFPDVGTNGQCSECNEKDRVAADKAQAKMAMMAVISSFADFDDVVAMQSIIDAAEQRRDEILQQETK